MQQQLNRQEHAVRWRLGKQKGSQLDEEVSIPYSKSKQKQTRKIYLPHVSYLCMLTGEDELFL